MEEKYSEEGKEEESFNGKKKSQKMKKLKKRQKGRVNRKIVEVEKMKDEE